MRKTEKESYDLEVIAGPCSLNPERIAELYEISEITVPDGRDGTMRGVSMIRCVGLKSNTFHDPTGHRAGIDSKVIEQVILTGSSDEVPPSVLFAEQFVKETGTGIAAEIMLPGIQLPFYEGRIPKGLFMPWNPSVNQLGWNVREMAHFASRNGYPIGLKNPKWLDLPLKQVNDLGNTISTTMERTWLGLASYASSLGCHVNFIHRGVDVSEKGEYRNAPVHEVVRRLARMVPDAGRYLDPSHILGPKLRDDIVRFIIKAMQMTVNGSYLYTGLLVEAGTSVTDTDQHITVDELRLVLREISKFRKLAGPFLPTE
jgi:hypothetical protein